MIAESFFKTIGCLTILLLSVTALSATPSFEGGTLLDYAAFSVRETSDGGYVVAGTTSDPITMDKDILVVKLNSSGSVEWSRVLGGSGNDLAYSVEEVEGGGYVVAGCTSSFGAERYDLLIVRLDGHGSVEWAGVVGGEGNDGAHGVRQTEDGGFVVAGYTSSFGAGGDDALIVKLDPSGTVEWAETIGGRLYDDVIFSVQQVRDGGYVLAGTTWSFQVGMSDALLIKLDRLGNLVWAETIGGAKYDVASSVLQTADGGYVAAGDSWSFEFGLGDAFVFKLDSEGGLEWAGVVGGEGNDGAHGVRQTEDGGFVVAGYTSSFGAGGDDALIVKLDPSGTVEWIRMLGMAQGESFRSIEHVSGGGYLLAGYTSSFGPGSYSMLLVKLDEEPVLEWSKIIGDKDASVLYTPSESPELRRHATRTGITAAVTPRVVRQQPDVRARFPFSSKIPVEARTLELVSRRVSLEMSVPYKHVSVIDIVSEWLQDNLALVFLLLPFLAIAVALSMRSLMQEIRARRKRLKSAREREGMISGKDLQREVFNSLRKNKLLIVTVGNELRGDDGFGPRVAQRLIDSGYRSSVINAGSVPENYISSIRRSEPDAVLFVDTVDADLPPGALVFGVLQEIAGDVRAVTTHRIPLRLLAESISNELPGVEIFLLGAQAGGLSLGSEMTQEVASAVEEVAQLLKRVLEMRNKRESGRK